MTAGVHRCLCTNTKPYSRSLHAPTPMSQSRVPYVYSASHLHQLRRVCVQQRPPGREAKTAVGLSGGRQLRGGWWSSIPPEPTAFKVRLRAVGCHLLAYTCRPLRVRGPACGLYRGRPLVRVRVYTCSTRGSPHAASPHQKASTERGSTRELMRGTGAGGSLQASATQLVAPLDPL
jgi:hypothetical protein